MKNEQNKIYLRRKNKVILFEGGFTHPSITIPQLATVNKNFEGLGYTLSEDVLQRLMYQPLGTVIQFYNETLEILKELKGVKNYRPMYPNFPQQVMDASDAELYFNAQLHYLSFVLADIRGDSNTWLPEYEKEERPALNEETNLITINLGSKEDFQKMFENMLSSKTSLSETDKQDLKWATNALTLVIPAQIPNKETLAFFGAIVENKSSLSKFMNTATDVLRLAVAMSDGDVSLAKPTKFRNFKAQERKQLLGLLNGLSNITEDMLRWKERWARLAKALRPFQYRNRFNKTAEAFDVICNDKPFETFNSKVEKALIKNNGVEAASLLSNRAGDFARRLDHVLRLTPKNVSSRSTVLSEFEGVAEKVSTPVLLQVLSHFKNRNSNKDLRVFFPKGNIAKLKAIENNLTPIPSSVSNQVVRIAEKTLMDRFSKLPELGYVYVDSRLSNYLVPFSQRSASKSLRTLVRGSRIDLGNSADTIRFFLWWKEGKVSGKYTGRVDIDLSATMFDENWNLKEYITFYNLRSAKYKGAHSGDITSAPNGACEFIDLDIPSILKYGGRYILPSVNSFTGQSFNAIPECFAGWMMRAQPESGEVFEPSTVVDRVDLSADTKVCIPAVIDLQERQIVWADLALKNNPNYSNHVHANLSSIALMGKSITELVKPNLYDLLRLHARARGKEVIYREQADKVFSVETGTPFELEDIVANYL